MKKSCFAVLTVLFALCSCKGPGQDVYASLDNAISLQDYYDIFQNSRQDSLRMQILTAAGDSLKWEMSYSLEKILSYRDIESCHECVADMMLLSCNDQQRRISEACYANILYKMDSLKTALTVLSSIDTLDLARDALGIYCFAAYHIYGKLSHENAEYDSLKRAIIDKWWKSDSTAVECAYYKNDILRPEGNYRNAIDRLLACNLRTLNDTAKFNYFLAKEYAYLGDTDKAIEYYAASAECDMRLGVKAYNALYELARILFRTGDIERADRYMRITLKDAYSSHYESRYDDVIKSELEIMNVLLDQQQKKKRAYYTTSVAVAMLLFVAIISIFLLGRYSSRLNQSRRQLSEVSRIKDSFLAMYMEKCVDYLNKVDEYRSTLRRTLKSEGASAVGAMLRQPSFASGEFDGLLEHFDSAFLGIFPDFVDKVNEHMQPEYRLEMPAKGVLSTELRILALIRMGISKRQKIAKVLNMSVTTVYSYHCNLQKHSLHPDSGFDSVISNL